MKKLINKKKRRITKVAKNVSYLAVVATGDKITGVTQKIDHLSKANEMSRWMDISSTGAGYGGRYHRVVHGHDILSNFSTVKAKFGAKAAISQYPVEILKDSSTPDGVPLPGVQRLVKVKAITLKNGATWGSVNMGKALSGVLAIYGTFVLYKAGKESKIKKPSNFIFAVAGVVTKIASGYSTQNPVLIVSGVTDIVILVGNRKQVAFALKKLFRGLRLVNVKTRKHLVAAYIKLIRTLAKVQKTLKKSVCALTSVGKEYFNHVWRWLRFSSKFQWAF